MKNEIVFDQTGTKWINIGQEHIYVDTNQLTQTEKEEYQRLEDYCLENLFVAEIVQEFRNGNHFALGANYLREYDNKELRMLYTIDPHGVAAYVKQYAYWKYNTQEQRLIYKDNMFRLLIGRNPEHYIRNEDGYWQFISEIDMQGISASAVASESEFVFGTRLIWDESVAWTACGVLLRNLVDILLGLTVIGEAVYLIYVIKNSSFESSLPTLIDSAYDGVVKQLAADKKITNRTEKLLGKVSIATEIATSAYELVQEMYAEAARLPYHEKKIYAYWIDVDEYDIYVKDYNGNIIKLNDIREAFNT